MDRPYAKPQLHTVRFSTLLPEGFPSDRLKEKTEKTEFMPPLSEGPFPDRPETESWRLREGTESRFIRRRPPPL